jgi:hypothetical protein
VTVATTIMGSGCGFRAGFRRRLAGRWRCRVL